MKQRDLIPPVIEPIGGRFDRAHLGFDDDRLVRGFDYNSAERRSREFVDPDTVAVTTPTTVENGYSSTAYIVTGTVTARHDSYPPGFDFQAFEARLAYNPNPEFVEA